MLHVSVGSFAPGDVKSGEDFVKSFTSSCVLLLEWHANTQGGLKIISKLPHVCDTLRGCCCVLCDAASVHSGKRKHYQNTETLARSTMKDGKVVAIFRGSYVFIFHHTDREPMLAEYLKTQPNMLLSQAYQIGFLAYIELIMMESFK